MNHFVASGSVLVLRSRDELYVWSCMYVFKIFGSRAVKSWCLTPTFSKLEDVVWAQNPKTNPG